MLVSFLIPSRCRFDNLKRLVLSIFEGGGTNFEIVVRLHYSDEESIKRIGELPDVRFIFGFDLNGYVSLCDFCAELVDEAKGDWCWHLNDDMVFQGEEGWQDELSAMPIEALVQPLAHYLNASLYEHDSAGPAPCHANEPWVAPFLRSIASPAVDINLHKEFVHRGRPVLFMEKVAIHHIWGGSESHVT